MSVYLFHKKQHYLLRKIKFFIRRSIFFIIKKIVLTGLPLANISSLLGPIKCKI